MSKTSEQAMRDRIDEITEQAGDRYNKRYNNVVYVRATAGKTTDIANLLIDDAMCLCGSPYYRYSRSEWDADARAFLALFC